MFYETRKKLFSTPFVETEDPWKTHRNYPFVRYKPRWYLKIFLYRVGTRGNNPKTVFHLMEPRVSPRLGIDIDLQSSRISPGSCRPGGKRGI
jgi:hypothetical protein